MRMSNQEAISVLESINAKTDYFLINDDARAEAIDIAIVALQARDLQSTCNQLATDTISRQAVLNLPQNKIRNIRGEVIERCVDVEAVKALPSADAVLVVRCVDCVCHSICLHEQYLGLNGFCSHGERREE